jgi:DNA-binding transcriptional ArsR family regulator/transcription elongation factor Elf1
MSDGTCVDRRSPEELFGLLGDGTRLEIVRALGEAGGPLAFAALRERVGVADSGNFNYHLGRLTGVLVRDAAEGYELTRSGAAVFGSILAGTYTADAAVEPITPGWDCQLCGGEMAVDYADERARVRCRDCGAGAQFPFPPGSVEGFDRAELPEAFARWWHGTVTRLVDGFCPLCAGRLDRTLAGPRDDDAERPDAVRFDCARCGETAHVSASTLASFQPVVKGFLAEHGFDLTGRHPSQVWAELDRWETSVRSEDPRRLTVQFGHAGEQVTVDIDEDGTVASVQRRDA